jgi:hypothetical protein
MRVLAVRSCCATSGAIRAIRATRAIEPGKPLTLQHDASVVQGNFGTSGLEGTHSAAPAQNLTCPAPSAMPSHAMPNLFALTIGPVSVNGAGNDAAPPIEGDSQDARTLPTDHSDVCALAASASGSNSPAGAACFNRNRLRCNVAPLIESSSTGCSTSNRKVHKSI